MDGQPMCLTMTSAHRESNTIAALKALTHGTAASVSTIAAAFG